MNKKLRERIAKRKVRVFRHYIIWAFLIGAIVGMLVSIVIIEVYLK